MAALGGLAGALALWVPAGGIALFAIAVVLASFTRRRLLGVAGALSGAGAGAAALLWCRASECRGTCESPNAGAFLVIASAILAIGLVLTAIAWMTEASSHPAEPERAEPS